MKREQPTDRPDIQDLVVKTGRCTRCETCLKTCPEGIIAMAQPGGYPGIFDAGCIRCGHCVAVCPVTALVHREIPAEAFSPLPRDMLRSVTPDTQRAFLEAKRSVRFFSPRPVEKGVLQDLLQAASRAPAENNRRAMIHLVITDTDLIHRLEIRVARYYRRLMKWLNAPVRRVIKPFAPRLMKYLEGQARDLATLMDRVKAGWRPVFRNAPVVVITCGEKGNPLARDNCIIAQQYLMLQAQAWGLGSCIIGYASSAPGAVGKENSPPGGYRIWSVTALGHPAAEFQKIPPRPAAESCWL